MLAQRLGWMETCPNQAIGVKTRNHQGVDEHARAIYRQNLKGIIASCRSQGIDVVFVPQILLEEVLRTGDYSWWIPFVPAEEMDDMMDAYNAALKEEADSHGVPFVAEALEYDWKASDFVDLSHFTSDANLRLAKMIANELQSASEKDSTINVN